MNAEYDGLKSKVRSTLRAPSFLLSSRNHSHDYVGVLYHLIQAIPLHPPPLLRAYGSKCNLYHDGVIGQGLNANGLAFTAWLPNDILAHLHVGDVRVGNGLPPWHLPVGYPPSCWVGRYPRWLTVSLFSLGTRVGLGVPWAGIW